MHIFTARAPFVRPSLFRNRNFAAGALFGVVIGLTYYASLAPQPPFLQNLMNYPIVSAGLVMASRGLGTMGAMLIVGRLVGRVDTRLLIQAAAHRDARSDPAASRLQEAVGRRHSCSVDRGGIMLGFRPGQAPRPRMSARPGDTHPTR